MKKSQGRSFSVQILWQSSEFIIVQVIVIFVSGFFHCWVRTDCPKLDRWKSKRPHTISKRSLWKIWLEIFQMYPLISKNKPKVLSYFHVHCRIRIWKSHAVYTNMFHALSQSLAKTSGLQLFSYAVGVHQVSQTNFNNFYRQIPKKKHASEVKITSRTREKIRKIKFSEKN